MSPIKKNTTDARTEVNRRKLLAGLSTLTASLTSSIWSPSTLFGADTKIMGDKHFIGFFTGNGTTVASFFPQSTGAESSALTSTKILAPLEKHFAKINVIKGLNHASIEGKADLHRQGPAAFLSGGYMTNVVNGGANIGAGLGPSSHETLDQLIVRLNGGSTFQYGFAPNRGEKYLSAISYKKSGLPAGQDQTVQNFPNDTLLDAYSRLGNPNAGQASAADLQRQLLENRSMLDYINSELKSLKGKMSSDDKIRLDSHLTGIREIEERLSITTSAQCSIPSKAPTDPVNRFDAIALEIDLMVLAHRCGIQKVSTFTLSYANSYEDYKFLNDTDPVQKQIGNHHEMSHGFDEGLTPGVSAADKPIVIADFKKHLLKINIYHAQKFNYLLTKLNESPDVNGSSLLDKAAVLWGSDVATGGHNLDNMPFILAGSAGGYFKTGRFLDYTVNNKGGLPHNKLLLSIAQSMGLAVTTMGVAGLDKGAPLTGITA